MNRVLTVVATLAFLAEPAVANDEFFVDCSTSPNAAVLEPPPPLNEWGTIACTIYGHVLGAKEGWIWSQPGTYAPVFIPSQMVRKDPEASGNSYYFSNISFGRASEKEREVAKGFMAGFDKEHGEEKKETELTHVNTALLPQLNRQEVVVGVRQHIESIEEAECDEMWSFVGNKAHQRWLW